MAKKSLPTFLGIGAQRAGTSWLYSQLIKHPEIWMPPVKEIHFFARFQHYPSPNDLATTSPHSRIFGSKSRERLRVIAGIKAISEHVMKGNLHQARWWSKWTFGYYNEDWYSGLFSLAESHKECGEITPSYSILEDEDIAKIKALNPDMKIIFIIRNPIERAWSAIRFHVHSGANLRLDSSDEIISVLKHPAMFLRGDYERTLDNFLKFFDSSQILVCFYDAIKNDPTGLMSNITEFIFVNPFSETVINNKVPVNPSPAYTMPIKVRDYLHKTYDPIIKRIADTFGSYAANWDRESNIENLANRLTPAVHP